MHLWIALLAVLFGALAPSVSRALAAAAPTPDSYLAEICSADGARTVSVTASGPASASGDAGRQPSSLAHGMDHCAFCLVHGASDGLPPPAPASFAVLGGHDIYPPLFYTAPATLHAWSAANPRAPPATP